MTANRELTPAPLAVITTITRNVLRSMSEAEIIAYHKSRQFLHMRTTITTNNEYEAWRLIHTLRHHGYAAQYFGENQVATNAPQQKARHYYHQTKD